MDAKIGNYNQRSLSPGVVDTEIFESFSTTLDKIQKILQVDKAVNGDDIGNAILYIISTPPHVQVTELTIQPVGQKE